MFSATSDHFSAIFSHFGSEFTQNLNVSYQKDTGQHLFKQEHLFSTRHLVDNDNDNDRRLFQLMGGTDKI